MMSHKIYPPKQSIKNTAWINPSTYQSMYQSSINEPDNFWTHQAQKFIDWSASWEEISNREFNHVHWFKGAKLNACHNCVDRHLPQHANQTAIIFEGDEPDQTRHISYQQLHDEICLMANILKKYGVNPGDRVCIYLPMIPEAAIAMLACARIGAVHSVVFAGFSPKALSERIDDAGCKVLITANVAKRAGKPIDLKSNVDEALTLCSSIEQVLVIQNRDTKTNMQKGRDWWYHSEKLTVASDCPCVPMDAESPLFILYTSGSTGKPKGVLHSTAGYLLQCAMSFRYIFDYHEGDIFWCSADVGWITGHSYMVYGPLANAATSLFFAGVPTYPTPTRYWDIIDKHGVNIFYTAPTAIRSLMQAGDEWLETTHRSSLKLLGSVGEPINPEVWEWYYHKVGHGQCPIVDTWWQTETGSILLSPLPGATDLIPGSACHPFFGIEPALLDSDGTIIDGPGEGQLVIKSPWPSMMRSIYGDHERFESLYLKQAPGYYYTGDGAKRDANGNYTITGRIDDVINVSGHRLGTAEIESALVEDEQVSEAAVVGYPHPIKGQGIYAFVSLHCHASPSEQLQQQLMQTIRHEIGPIAKPDVIQWAPSLPKTRSGKIMRRILRKIAAKEFDNMGDLSTLAEPKIVDDIIQVRKTL